MRRDDDRCPDRSRSVLNPRDIATIGTTLQLKSARLRRLRVRIAGPVHRPASGTAVDGWMLADAA